MPDAAATSSAEVPATPLVVNRRTASRAISRRVAALRRSVSGGRPIRPGRRGRMPPSAVERSMDGSEHTIPASNDIVSRDAKKSHTHAWQGGIAVSSTADGTPEVDAFSLFTGAHAESAFSFYARLRSQGAVV